MRVQKHLITLIERDSHLPAKLYEVNSFHFLDPVFFTVMCAWHFDGRKAPTSSWEPHRVSSLLIRYIRDRTQRLSHPGFRWDEDNSCVVGICVVESSGKVNQVDRGRGDCHIIVGR